jgi:hypothetical protein
VVNAGPLRSGPVGRVPLIMEAHVGDEAIGPVELALVEFPNGSVDPKIVEALADLVGRGIVSILDLLMISRDDDGSLEVVELADAEGVVAEQFADLDGEVMWLLSADDVAAAAGTLAQGSTGVLVVWESSWARDLRSAVRGAGGRLLIHDRLDADEVASAMEATLGG